MKTSTQTKPQPETSTAEVLERQDFALVATPARATPDDMIRTALERGIDVEELERLYALKRQFDADEARKAFTQAKADFKRNPPKIVKDMLNKQYGSSYASISSLVNTTNEALAPHGFDASWSVVEQTKDGMKVACILTHALGHSERAEVWGPMDTSGQKNPLQAVKSTMTYLKMATFEAVTGVASRAGNTDDDGGGSHGKKETDEERQKREHAEQVNAEWVEAINACETLADYEGQRVDLIAAYGGSANKVPKNLRDLCVERRKYLQERGA